MLASGTPGAEASSRLPLLLKGKADVVRYVAAARAPSAHARVAAGDAGESGQEEDTAVIAEIVGGIGIT